MKKNIYENINNIAKNYLELNKVTLLIALFFLSFSYSQANKIISDNIDHYSNVVPETPNATSFIKYGNTSINLAKGQPNISIPIYTLSVDGLNIPISLSYDASGIKTDELSTSVGLKWQLNTGGGVFRSINGLPDDNGWLSEDWTSRDSQWYIDNPWQDNKTQEKLKTQNYDHYPDNFSYSIAGYFGKFIFKRKDVSSIIKNKNDNFTLIPNRSTQEIQSFTGKDVNGNTFYFGNSINSREVNSTTVINGNHLIINSTTQGNSGYSTSSWLIEKIITKNGEQINFQYEPYEIDYTLYQKSETVTRYNKVDMDAYWGVEHCRINGGQSGYKCGTKCDVLPNYEKNPDAQITNSNHVFNHFKTSVKSTQTNRLIKKISTKTIEVTFNYEDVNSNAIWKKKLSNVVILDLIQGNSKTYEFLYDTYEGDQRLQLKEIKEVNGNEEKPGYKFYYINGKLPNKNTFSKDKYGYYNGRNNISNIPFTPSVYANLPPQLTNLIADKKPSLEHAKIGNLKEIQYPTGGKTEFEYELNEEEDNSEFADIDYEKGGFNLQLNNNNFRTIHSKGYRSYSYHFTVPEELITRNTYTGYANISISSTSNAVDSPGENLCNDPSVDPGIDCSRFDLIDKSNNMVVKRNLLGNTTVTNLSPGNYTLVVVMRESEVVNSPNLNVQINFQWYNYKTNSLGESIKVPFYAGGLRVKSTRDIDTDRKVYNWKQYEYENLKGLKYKYDHYSKSKINNEYIISSEYIGDSKLFKPGYFYEKVTIKNSGYNNDGIYFENKIVNTFQEDNDNSIKGFKNKGVFIYNTNNDLVSKKLFVYETRISNYYYLVPGLLNYCYNEKEPRELCPSIVTGYNEPQSTYYSANENRLVKEIETLYFYNNNVLNGNITSVNNFSYNSDELKTEIESNLNLTEVDNLDFFNEDNYTLSQNNLIKKTHYTYPKSYSLLSNLVSKNILSIPVSIKQFKNEQLLNGNYFIYDSYGNLNKNYKYVNGYNSSNSYSYIPNNYCLDNTYLNENGKLKEKIKNNDIPTAYIWGYQNSLVIAKIVGVSYDEIPKNIISNLKLASNNDVNQLSENALRIKLSDLRTALPNAQVTTYTYDPLIGVTSITDPRGETIYYEYDEFNRLKFVKDSQENILKQHQYNYKNE